MNNLKYQNQLDGLCSLISQKTEIAKIVIYIASCKPNVDKLAQHYKSLVDSREIQNMREAIKEGDTAKIQVLSFFNEAAREYYETRMKESHTREQVINCADGIMSVNPIWDDSFEYTIKKDSVVITLKDNYSTSAVVYFPNICSRLDKTVDGSNLSMSSSVVGSEDLSHFLNAVTFATILCSRLDEALIPALRNELDNPSI